MSLKQSIVVVNEYTVKNSNGGSRGGTPGDYVLRYMAREDAIERLTPAQTNAEAYILRYMVRESAVDKAETLSDLKKDLRNMDMAEGVAFGYGDVSLSHKKLKKAAKDIQKNFDKGKTVMKTVLSFEEDYLRKYGLVAQDFAFEKEGDYKGNIDQMKLRMAIMNGLDQMSRNYDDLQYIGVIQVDTKHVHCHLAMVDRGEGKLASDGTQKGKINDNDKRVLRRGIDSYLDQKQCVKMMSANVQQDKTNTVYFTKKFTHKAMQNRGFTQFLLACLPDDKNAWRANTNRKDMRKANAMVREYVHAVLEQPDSGYQEALSKVDLYAKERVRNEGLSLKDYRSIYDTGRNRIITESMNSVYSMLKNIPDSEKNVRTPMLEVMSMQYEDMANKIEDNPMMEFGFKLRSYKTRLEYHKNERHKFHNAVNGYKARQKKGEADMASLPLLTFFQEEERYNAMLVSKYQHFLDFVPIDKEYHDELDLLIAERDRIDNMEQMTQDRYLRRLSADKAETYGQQVYGVSGGHNVISNIQTVYDDIDLAKNQYEIRMDAFRVKLADNGLRTVDDKIERHIEYDFDDVKALDLHHLQRDFKDDMRVSVANLNTFRDVADIRYEAFQNAKQYLINSGQAETLSQFNEDDIVSQKRLADKLAVDRVIYTQREQTDKPTKVVRTIPLDNKFYAKAEPEMKEIIRNTVKEIEFEM